MATKKTIRYSEPVDYFPKEIRKKHGIGEFAEKKTEDKKAPAKKAVTKKK